MPRRRLDVSMALEDSHGFGNQVNVSKLGCVLCRSAIHYSHAEVGLCLLFIVNDEVLPGLG